MVIAPGTHTLTIRYWVKSAADNTEAHITKYVQGTFAPNSMTEITAKLDNSYNNVKYYLWDAKKDLWDGLESTQPKTTGASAPTGLKIDDGTPRNTHERMPLLQGQKDQIVAVNSCVNQPNSIEYKWYQVGGDWYADNYEAVVLMGHLYRGGLWCKKRSYISGFNSVTAPTPLPWGVLPTEGRPAYQDLNKYFYLPHLGYYRISGAVRGDDMSATFVGAAGIDGFMTWGRDIEELYGAWYYSGGHIVPNDFYNPCSSTIYSHIFHTAIPIYKFE